MHEEQGVVAAAIVAAGHNSYCPTSPRKPMTAGETAVLVLDSLARAGYLIVNLPDQHVEHCPLEGAKS